MWSMRFEASFSKTQYGGPLKSFNVDNVDNEDNGDTFARALHAAVLKDIFSTN